MKDMELLIEELIHELGKMDIKELYEFKKAWSVQLKESGLNERIQFFCNKMVELVIEKKEEKREHDKK